MTFDTHLVTERLIIRPWTEDKRDADAFHLLNSDKKIMEFFPFRRTRNQSDEMLEKVINTANENGYGWSSVCLRETGEPIGFSGLSVVNFEAHFTPATEIGWRILPAHMGKGYATEAARELLRFGFEELNLPEIIAFAVPQNIASTAIMKKIGMKHNPQKDFDMPGVHEEHPFLVHCVFYALSKFEWKCTQ